MAKDKNALGRLSRILGGLGDNPDGVAEVLRANGCRGYRHSGFPSPIIRYAYYWFDDGSLTLAYSDWNQPDRLGFHGIDGCCLELTLPTAVVEFFRRFDAGEYPDRDLELVGPRVRRR